MNTQGFKDEYRDDDAETLLNEGIFITKTEFLEVEISLYRLNDKFFEVWHSSNPKEVIKIAASTESNVNPYIKHLALFSLN